MNEELEKIKDKYKGRTLGMARELVLEAITDAFQAGKSSTIAKIREEKIKIYRDLLHKLDEQNQHGELADVTFWLAETVNQLEKTINNVENEI